MTRCESRFETGDDLGRGHERPLRVARVDPFRGVAEEEVLARGRARAARGSAAGARRWCPGRWSIRGRRARPGSRLRRDVGTGALDEREVGRAVAQRRRNRHDDDVETAEVERITRRVVTGLERGGELLVADVFDVRPARGQCRGRDRRTCRNPPPGSRPRPRASPAASRRSPGRRSRLWPCAPRCARAARRRDQLCPSRNDISLSVSADSGKIVRTPLSRAKVDHSERQSFPHVGCVGALVRCMTSHHLVAGTRDDGGGAHVLIIDTCHTRCARTRDRSRVSARVTTVREGGLEPPRPCGHRNLNPARLPIPPLARVSG